MHARMLLALVAVAGLVLASLAVGAPEPADEREALLAADRAFDQATAEKGIEGWVAFFAPNGSMLPGNDPPVTGPEAIREFMGPTLAQPDSSLRWQPTRAEVLIPGVLGMTTGRWERRSVDAEGKPMSRMGTYVTIWKKQPDGAWKVVFDTGNPDPPETKPN